MTTIRKLSEAEGAPPSRYSVAEAILDAARRRTAHLREASLASRRYGDHLEAGAYAHMNRLAAKAMDHRIHTLGKRLDALLERREATLAEAAAITPPPAPASVDIDWLGRLGGELLGGSEAPRAKAIA